MTIATQSSLFGDNPAQSKAQHTSTLPVSVVNIAPSRKNRSGEHNARSSRAGFSPFPMEVAALCFDLYLRDCSHVFDPFAGWGERGAVAASRGVKYTGIDNSPDAIASAAQMGVVNTLGDSLTAPLPEFDGLITCPPYWDLEKYAGDDCLSALPSWKIFCEALWAVFRRCYDAAKPGAVFCVSMGNWRTGGVFYDLQFELADFFRCAGAETIDRVVLSRLNTSKVKVMIPQARRLGYTVKVHEYLDVYRKPEPRDA